MANLNFTLREEDWYESQPIQLSTEKFAISINFGDAANNRVVVYKSCNGAWVVIAEVGKNVYTD